LLVCSALVGVSVALASGSANAQATIELDLGTPTYTLSADVGSMLPQSTTATVSGTTSGTTGVIELTSDIDNTVTYDGAYLMEDNTLAADATGNTANGTVSLTFTPGVGSDTAAGGVFQSVTADITATVSGSQHLVQIENFDTVGGADVAELTGTLLVDNNDLLASATANSASTTLSLANGVNVGGTGSAAQIAVDSTLAAATDSDSAADLLISQGQTIAGTGTDIVAQVKGGAGGTGNNDVDVYIDSVDGATLTLSNSDIQATATGNSLSASIVSSDTTALIGATSAAVGLQSIYGDVDALTDYTRITVNIDSTNGLVDDSTLTVADNAIGATATGATATQSIALVANQITGGGSYAGVYDPTAAGVQIDASAGHIAASTQTLYDGSTVTSLANYGEVRLDTSAGSPSGLFLRRNTLAVTDNSIASSSLGLDATNSVGLQAGSTLSSTGAVASVQFVNGEVTADTDRSSIVNNPKDDVLDSTVLTTGNLISASSTGARVNNDLVVSNTDVLSLSSNTGSVSITADPVSATDEESPSVSAGFVISNDQEVNATDVTAEVSQSAVLTEIGDDIYTSTVNTDNNEMIASAIGASANNAISLSFNVLDGSMLAGGDVVAAAANSQRVDGSSDIWANVYDGRPIEVVVGNDIEAGGSTVTINGNAIRASATGNASTGTTVSVDATNVGITGGVDGTASVDKLNGDISADAAFLAANQQELDNTRVYAGQVNNQATPTASNLIVFDIDDRIEDATVQMNSNVMSVAATGNTAITGVSTGTDATATVQASSAVVSYQDLADATIQGALGTLGSDGVTPFYSESVPSVGGSYADGDIVNVSSGTYQNVTGSSVSIEFENLTSEEIDILETVFTAANVATVGSTTTVTWPDTYTAVFTGYLARSEHASNDLDTIDGFERTGNQGNLNTAGVIQELGTGEAAGIFRSTLTVDENTMVGEVRGNVATNSVTATATTLTAFATGDRPSTDTDATTVVATDADNALTNVQEVDGTTVLTNTVAGAFALKFVADPETDGLDDSSLSVSDNLLQSYATTNTASNTVTLTATNSNAGAALLNEQSMAAPAGSGVVTVSDMDVASHAGTMSSDQALDNNTNQSVASANVETSTVTVSVTNGSPVNGTADALFTAPSNELSADAILASEQRVGDQVNPTPTISASATTDVFNRDLNDTTANQVVTSTLSMSGNDTIAQSTANTSTTVMALGDSGTASYDASGAIVGQQVISDNAVINAVTDVEVGVALRTNDPDNAAFQSSTVGIDGNTATALARGNVETTTLTVTSANIDAGAATDAAVGATDTYAAYMIRRAQTSGGDLSANSSDATFSLSAVGENSATEASDSSTLSVSSNLSSATAVGNTATNRVVLGSDSTATLASTGLLFAEQVAGSNGSVSATGGMSATAGLSSASVDNNTVMNGTTLTLAGNTSSASATANSVSNTFTANATNMTAGLVNTDAYVSNSTSSAANLLRSYQTATQTVQATNTANTVTATIGTGAADDGETTTAVNASTVAVTGNAINAYATGNSAGNTAANSMSIGGAGTSTLSATAGLANIQQQNGAITASGSARVGVIADGAIDPASTTAAATALNASTVSVADNSVMVMARGNLANNALSVGATSATGGDGADGVFNGTAVQATYALGNFQTNTGPVTSNSDGVEFGVALNGSAAAYGAAAAGSTIGVSGNSVMAAAYGNVATNNLAVASLEGVNDDATAITASYQLASGGAIQANVTNGFAGVDALGRVGSSTVSVRGNTFTARAVGNFATSVVTRR
jgi:hypothetical protein